MLSEVIIFRSPSPALRSLPVEQDKSLDELDDLGNF
jgi:hypothetical protein